jgi:hypothetical protein
MKKSLFVLLFGILIILPMTVLARRFSPPVAVDESPNLGVFDPYWDRDQWIWEDSPDDNPPMLKHKTLKDCYVDGDQSGEVFTDFKITREKKKLFGSLYLVTRTYDEKNVLSEIYYAKNGVKRHHVLTVFVGKGANKCIAKAEEILRRYESQQAK